MSLSMKEDSKKLVRGITGLLILCACSFVTLVIFSGTEVETDGSAEETEQTETVAVSMPTEDQMVLANVLSAQDTLEVNAVGLVNAEGHIITSAVCEVVSSELFMSPTPQSIWRKIVFHSFRVTVSGDDSELILLFVSNHSAYDGKGLTVPVNSLALRLFPNFPNSSTMTYPITVITDGAQVALECANQAGEPLLLDLGDFDFEEWRLIAIEKLGPEKTYDDGSKADYVEWAVSICNQGDTRREIMLTNMIGEYEGSWPQFVIETFCPYVNLP